MKPLISNNDPVSNTGRVWQVLTGPAVDKRARDERLVDPEEATVLLAVAPDHEMPEKVTYEASVVCQTCSQKYSMSGSILSAKGIVGGGGSGTCPKCQSRVSSGAQWTKESEREALLIYFATVSHPVGSLGTSLRVTLRSLNERGVLGDETFQQIRAKNRAAADGLYSPPKDFELVNVSVIEEPSGGFLGIGRSDGMWRFHACRLGSNVHRYWTVQRQRKEYQEIWARATHRPLCKVNGRGCPHERDVMALLEVQKRSDWKIGESADLTVLLSQMTAVSMECRGSRVPLATALGLTPQGAEELERVLQAVRELKTLINAKPTFEASTL